MQSQKVEIFAPEDVFKRIPLLKRIVADAVACYEVRRRKRERLEELKVISAKFNSFEIQETISNLKREIAEHDREMESYEREVRLLGGVLKDARRGLAYFYSLRDGRRIFLVWDSRQPDTVSWHELDESFADRNPLDYPEGARASAVDYPEG